MSALPPKADICSALGHVRFTPNSDISALEKSPDPWPEIQDEVDIGSLSALTNFFFGAFLARLSQNAKEKLTALRTLWDLG
jgi:hypothetical protein